MSRRRPRLLVVGCRWPLQTFLRRLFEGLTESFEVRLATREPFRADAFRRTALASESWPRLARGAHALTSGAPAFLRPAGRRLLAADGWRRLPFLRHVPDLLYLPWNATAVSHLPLLQVGIPSVVSCRGSHVQVASFDPRRRAMTAGFPASFEAATRVHCVSRAILEAARGHGLDPAKARVIPPAVDTEVFTPTTEPPGGPPWRLVSVGNLEWVKGFEDALVAVRHLADAGLDVRFDLVGEGRERQRLRFAVGDLGLEERVTLHGRRRPEEVRRLLRGAHVFLLSSLSEGISNAALEAMSCGLPVVSTRCGGMAELIEDGENGLLVPVQDPAALAAAAGRLLQDAAARRRLGAAARRRVEEDFRLDHQVDAFRQLCFEALEDGRFPGVEGHSGEKS